MNIAQQKKKKRLIFRTKSDFFFFFFYNLYISHQRTNVRYCLLLLLLLSILPETIIFVYFIIVYLPEMLRQLIIIINYNFTTFRLTSRTGTIIMFSFHWQASKSLPQCVRSYRKWHHHTVLSRLPLVLFTFIPLFCIRSFFSKWFAMWGWIISTTCVELRRVCPVWSYTLCWNTFLFDPWRLPVR